MVRARDPKQRNQKQRFPSGGHVEAIIVSASASTASGERGDSPFGPSPTGILTYAREGRIAVMVSYSGRKHSLPIRSWHPLKKEPRLSPQFPPMREGTHILVTR